MSAIYIKDGKHFIQVSFDEMQLVKGEKTISTDNGDVRLQVNVPVVDFEIIGPFDEYEAAVEALRQLDDAYDRWLMSDAEALAFFVGEEEE